MKTYYGNFILLLTQFPYLRVLIKWVLRREREARDTPEVEKKKNNSFLSSRMFRASRSRRRTRLNAPNNACAGYIYWFVAFLQSTYHRFFPYTCLSVRRHFLRETDRPRSVCTCLFPRFVYVG